MNRFPLIALLAILQSACNWVDSTGAQAEPGAANDDGVTVRLLDGGAVTLLEEVPVVAQVSASAATRGKWTWSQTGEDADPASCGDAAAFDPAITQTRLALACTNLNDCSLAIDEIDNNTALSFRIRAPRLNAPTVIAMEGSAIDDFGNRTGIRQTLCLQSINEAPLAQDDHYRVVNDRLRTVAGSDSDSLLRNDLDDDDIRNQPLRVDTVPVIAPRHAAEFSLESDGGFRYRSAPDVQPDPDGMIRDSFVYAVSDGLHRVTATAHIDIVTDNRSPVRNDRLPDIDIALDELQNGLFEFVVADYFSDPDDDPLFYLTNSSLPDAGTLALTDDGRLFGMLTPGDVGTYRITIVASDGLSSVADTLLLSIVTTHRPNRAPDVDDIDNRTVSDRFSYDVAGFFDDPDDDPLSFTATGLPTGVSISTDGVISGTASFFNRGRWLVRVTAYDGRGGAADDTFRLTIR